MQALHELINSSPCSGPPSKAYAAQHRTLTFQYLAVLRGARIPCIRVDWVGTMIHSTACLSWPCSALRANTAFHGKGNHVF